MFYVVCACYLLSHVWLLATPWGVTHQAPLSMWFSRQEYWSGLSFPSPFYVVLFDFLWCDFIHVLWNWGLLYGPVIVPLDIYPNELKIYVHAKNSTQILTAALFIIARIWKPPRCLSGGEWIHKLMHPDNGILFRDKEMSHPVMKRQGRTWNECYSVKSVWKGHVLCDSNCMTFWKRPTYGDSNRIRSYQRLGGGEGWTGRAAGIFMAVELSSGIL